MFRKIAGWFRRDEDLGPVVGGPVSGAFHEGAWLSGAVVLHKEALVSEEARLVKEALVSGEVWWDRPVGWSGVAHSEARVNPSAASSAVLHSDARVSPEAWEEER